MSLSVDDVILDIIRSHGPVTTKQILELAKQKNLPVEKEHINSILYGYLREVVVRERNTYNVPTWRIKTKKFEAGKGYESHLFNELVKQKIIKKDEAFLDFEIRNPRNNKTYHLDIALFHENKKFNIEVDGFEHMRADSRLSIQNQIRKNGQNCDIEIDWMDNKTSYTDFKKIDSTRVNNWCSRHLSWCIKFHEELLWPHDITRNIFLIDNGWHIIRFWNNQVKNDVKTCVKEVEEWMRT